MFGGGFGRQSVFGMGIALGFQNNASTGMRGAKGDFDQLRMSASAADTSIKNSLENSRRHMAGFTKSMAVAGAAFGAIGWLSGLDKEAQQYTADLRSLGIEGAQAYINAARKTIAQEGLPIDYYQGLSEMYNLASGGLYEGDLIPGLKAAGITALATVGDISQAVDAMVRDYGIGMKYMTGDFSSKSAQWSDIVAASVQTYKTKLPELAEQHKKVAAEAGSMGYGLEQTYTAIGALMAPLGQEAGTSLTAVLRNISRASRMTGLEFLDAEKRAKPLLEIVDLLIGKYGTELDQIQQDELLKAFDVQGKKAILTLMQVRDQYALGLERAKEMGFSMKMAGDRTDTLKYKTVELKNAWKNLNVEIGMSSEAGEKFTEKATSVLRWLETKAAENQWLTKTGYDALWVLGGVAGLSALGHAKGLLASGLGKMPILKYAANPLTMGLASGLLLDQMAMNIKDWHEKQAYFYSGDPLRDPSKMLRGAPLFLSSSVRERWLPGGFGLPLTIPASEQEMITTDAAGNRVLTRKETSESEVMRAYTFAGRPVPIQDMIKPPSTSDMARDMGVARTEKPSITDNSTNHYTFVSNTTDPKQAQKEFEKFLRDKKMLQTEELEKRWLNRRRGEAPGEYEN